MAARTENMPDLWRGLVSTLDQLPEPLAVLGDWDADDGVVLHINPAWTGLTGFTASEVLGRSAMDVVFAKENEPAILTHIREANATGRTYRGRVLQAGSDGTSLAVRLRSGPIQLPGDVSAHIVMASTTIAPGGVSTPRPSCKILNFARSGSDAGATVQTRQRLAEHLVESHITFQHHLANCPFPIAHIARDGQIVYANPVFHQLLGFPAHALIERNIYQQFEEHRAKALRAYLDHFLVRRPKAVPIIASCRKEDGSRMRVRLDWSYAKDPAGAVTGLICVATPLDRHGAERPIQTVIEQAGDPFAEQNKAPHRAMITPGQDALLQAIQAARVWTSILSHRHPEDDDAGIIAKIDESLGEALQTLGAERSAHIGAADYYADTSPLKGLVAAIVEEAPLLRDSLSDLLRSWGCRTVSVSRPENAVNALKRAGRLPDMLVVALAAGIGLEGASAVRVLWRQYGPGLPAVLIADSPDPELEHLATAVGLRILRRPIHPIALRSAILNLLNDGQTDRR